MAAPTGRFLRGDRLLRSADFGRISREGRRVTDASFVFLAGMSPGSARQPRLGITMSRKVGGAVVRNRVKRRVREWFRSARGRLEPATDLVVIGRAPAAELSSCQTQAALSQLAQRAGIARC